MRLSKVQIEDISGLILKEFKKSSIVSVNVPDERVSHRIAEIFTKDLMVEDELDKEVEKILAAYNKEFETGKMEYRKTFAMVKEKLIKERELVI